MVTTQKQVWIHLILTSQKQIAVHNTGQERMFHNLMRKLFFQINCSLNIVNGTSDHVHFLYNQNPNISTDEVVNHIKINSAQFFIQHNFSDKKIFWHSGYVAYSISYNAITKTIKFIEQQKIIHQQVSLEEEMESYHAANLIDNIFGEDNE